MRTVRTSPGGALLHPLAVLSLLVLVVNDHWLKHTHPGFLSGKLSDFAGLILLPLFLHALFELAFRRASPRTSNRALALSLALTAVIFALPELWPAAETAYRYAFGALQWPFRIAASWLRGAPPAAFAPVNATADPTDLLALPMLFAAWRVARKAPALLVLPLALLFTPATAHAAPRTHDGFYASFDAGPEILLLQSSASVSNGFRQSIDSSASAFSVPSWSLALGGTLRGTGVVLGGTLGYAYFRDPIVKTLGTRFELTAADLEAFHFGGFARYYPDPQRGLSLGLGAGAMSLELKGPGVGGHDVKGPYLAIEAGYGFWLGRQWSLGVNARVTAAQLHGDVGGATRVLMPGLFAAITWH